MANDQAIEQLKRQLYFDLKRDEEMAMAEYLVSPISDLDLRNSGKAGGGMASLNYLLRPISMAGGGSATLGDSAIKMETLVKKLELQSILPLDLIDKMETMSPKEIDDLYNKYIRK
mgnify:FL=1|jgi:hypothetical protein|tara:strand:+ start:218 stop:565 length:348 start_codon:yes stop_codon:yes gene_type:complete